MVLALLQLQAQQMYLLLVEVTGFSATASVASTEQFPVIWGQVLPSQTPNFSAIGGSAAPPLQVPSWIDLAA